MDIFCINLDRAPERWTQMQAQAARLGLTLRRMAAVDGQDPAQSEALAAVDRIGPLGAMGPGTLACSLSHQAVWREIAASNGPAVVLEDDVLLAEDLAEVIAALAPVLAPCALVKLEETCVTRDGILVGAARPLTPRRGLRRAHQLATGSAGYVMTPSMAAHALQAFADCAVPVDHFLFYPRQVTGFLGQGFDLIDPLVVVQDPEIVSQIAPTRQGAPRRGGALRRGMYEAAQAPGLLRALAGGARLRKLRFQP